MSLHDIAGRMSFSSISYFSRYVKNTLGTTPTEYRKAIKTKSETQKSFMDYIMLSSEEITNEMKVADELEAQVRL